MTRHERPTHEGRLIGRRGALATIVAAAGGVVAGVSRRTQHRKGDTAPALPRLSAPDARWWSDATAGSLRQPVAVSAAGYSRVDRPIEIDLGIHDVAPDSVRVVEIDQSGAVLNGDVVHQYDPALSLPLVLLANGRTAAGSTRHFHVYYDRKATSIPAKVFSPLVELDEHHHDEGQDAYLVRTRTGTYSYQRKGASLSSLVDVDGFDWLSYHAEPGPGPRGANGFYRGMPNFHFPDGNFHPGFEVSQSELLASGPLRVVVRSTSHAGGDWTYETSFFPDFARSTITKAAAKYWFLYEGTPGGESARGAVKPFKVLRADGVEFGHRDDWVTKFKGEAWAAFRSPGLGAPYGRTFFLAHHDVHPHVDSYYLARNDGAPVGADDMGSMTVFGFGRDHAEMSMTDAQSPNQFTFGLMQPSDATDAVAAINAAYRAVATRVGSAEHRPPR